jgi:hypothetical protein
MEWAQVATIIGALATMVGLQTFWVGRALDSLRSEMYRGFDAVNGRLDRVEARLDRVEARLDGIEGTVLRDHAERIARLEAQGPPTLRPA